ncbi:MAG TPA: squalene--hopene cyclase [Solirubrobacteraceae bacterium]|jgi:squalene-hopene/tetraprenyl-beta-curcumene cyclase
MPPSTLEKSTDARIALERAREHLLALQDDAGWWKGELQTNVTMDAEDMLLREFLGIRTTAETERSAAWIRSQQRADGTWSNFYGGDGDLSTTIEAYWALRLAGDSAQDAHMRAAADFIRAGGGLQRARVFTHVWLALFGLWSWERVPALPPEIVLLPSSVALNIYDFACWARQTIVALTIVIAHRPHRALPFDLDELQGAPIDRPRASGLSAGAWLTRLDRLLRLYERRPLAPLRRLALARAERWIVRRQEADGSWGGIQPPWVYSLMALHLAGYPLEHPVMRRGLEGLDRFMVEDRDDGSESRPPDAPAGPSRRLEACQSPVWDTALAAIALADAGVPGEHPAMRRAMHWLQAEEVLVRGDWAVARPQLEAGGWAFEFANDNYPDTDDTAEVALALLHAAPADRERAQGALDRAALWLEGMQSTGGGWGAFDADNTRALVRELPFLDFGEVIDEPSADVTAHVLELLAAVGRSETPVARAGLRWLLDQQEADGSWFGRWGINYIYGTGAALPALIAMGVAPQDTSVRRAVRWLEEHQNEDGGWGEDPRSYDDPAWVGRGDSTASQTAWALLALHAAGEAREPSEAVARGIAWLVQVQRVDGTWDEPQYTGTGFPSDYYINYHLYRLSFPVMALGRCLDAAV